MRPFALSEEVHMRMPLAFRALIVVAMVGGVAAAQQAGAPPDQPGLN
jgi:hypothetical protein